MARLLLHGDHDAEHIRSTLASRGVDLDVVVTPTDDTTTPLIEGDLTLADLEAIRDVMLRESTPERSDLGRVVTKARAVWGGTDTFTAAQVQKTLAGLVLLEAKRR